MKISTHNLSLDTFKYNEQGNFTIPLDAKIMSIIFNGFDIQIIYQHQSDSIMMNTSYKKLYWYRVDAYAHNSNIYNLVDNLELKYGVYYNKLESHNYYLEGHLLYQVEKSIDEVRDDKLDYLLT